MKKLRFVLVAAFAAITLTASAQYIPTHDKYVTWVTDSKSFQEYFPTWEPGTKLSEDENFFISRVKPQPRFVNRNTQARNYTDNDNQRKFSLDTPMGVSDTYWQCLPRYVFDGDVFSMWSYVDEQGGWSKSWIRNTGAYSDICHKNGVLNSGGVMFFDSWGGDNTGPQKIVDLLVTKNSDDTFMYLDKFIKFLRYYGIDGVAFNPEGTIKNASLFQDFLAAVHEKAADYGWQFSTNWYGANTNGGYLDLGNTLNNSNSNWFVKGGKVVNDIYFLNYGVQDPSPSLSVAESLLAGSSNNVYVGFDIQGNWMGRGSWTGLAKTKASVVFWGNHTTDMIYQNSTEQGSSDEAVQKCYQEKLEQVFSGGNRNPANTPAVVDGIGESGASAMKKFHGLAAIMPARSTLQTLPFVTRFSLGNGLKFRLDGQETFQNKWYGLSTQDYLPTWRWWISKDDGSVPTDGIECNFTYKDSWWAGSCLRFSGATVQSDVRLFKTNFNVSAGDAVNLVYKLNGGTESKAKLFWSFVGSEKTLHYADIPAAEEVGQWTEFSTTASKIGMTGNVAVLGIKFENTNVSYEMLLGEMGIVPQKTWNPVKPTIETATLLERTYSSLSYKLIWNCTPLKAQTDSSIPVYNEDCDTWYYEVYSQMEGQEPVLDGCTTSWAHYVVGAKTDSSVKNYRIGVRAVAPDGRTKSDIAWSSYQTVETTQVEGIEIDKPVIKVNEEFRVQFKDPTHAPAIKWSILDPYTGKDVTSGESGPSKPEFSTDGDEKYYYIKFMYNSDGSSDIHVLDVASSGSKATVAMQVSGKESQLWKFVGDEKNGFTITSKSGLTLYTASGSKNDMVYGATSPSSTANKLFVFTVSENEEEGLGGELMLSPKTNTGVFFNQWGGAKVGNEIGLWDSEEDSNSPVRFLPQTSTQTGVSCSIDRTGSFDVAVEETSGTTYYRGFVQISGDEVGSIPLINDFTADKTILSSKENTANVTFDINRLGEGTASQGLEIEDPYMFMLPKEALPMSQGKYSIGFWYKPSKFSPSKYGTNLINQRNLQYHWPNNNWGTFWVHIWPETYYNGVKVMEDNAISYTMYGNEATKSFCGNSNKHEIPNLNCYTGDYGLSVGTWTHVMITYDGSKQYIFFNGKLITSCSASKNSYIDSNGTISGTPDCPIYIGGSNVYHSGMFGVIDDVQVWWSPLTTESQVKEAMQGYYGKTKPSGLAGYWSLENCTITTDTSGKKKYLFPNEVTANSSWNAEFISFNGAGGEATSTATYSNEQPTVSAGCPALPGTLPVKTTALLESKGMGATTNGVKGGTLTAISNGKYDVSLTLTNAWGSTTLTKPEYIEVSDMAGISSVENKETRDDCAIYNLAGQKVQESYKGILIRGGKKVLTK